MNKIQWLLIVFSFLAFLEYKIFGPNVIFYLFLLLAVSFFLFLIFKPKYCANCGTKLPIVRKPSDFRNSLLGGWVCPKCKANLDSSGKVIK